MNVQYKRKMEYVLSYRIRSTYLKKLSTIFLKIGLDDFKKLLRIWAPLSRVLTPRIWKMYLLVQYNVPTQQIKHYLNSKIKFGT